MDALAAKNDSVALSLLALSHSQIEHRLYEVLLAETSAAGTCVGTFSLRRLLELSRLGSYTTVRRARSGLITKLSIDCPPVAGDGNGAKGSSHVYLVFSPEEIFERRRRAGLAPYPKGYEEPEKYSGISVAIERVVSWHNLSRREAQVALCCAEGLTNSEIAERLSITEQTVKFHLSRVFEKFGVRRRGELISRLLRQDGNGDGAAARGLEGVGAEPAA